MRVNNGSTEWKKGFLLFYGEGWESLPPFVFICWRRGEGEKGLNNNTLAQLHMALAFISGEETSKTEKLSRPQGSRG